MKVVLEGAGEIVTWNAPKSVGFTELKNAVTYGGLDEKIVRDMCPANAFRRSIHALEENRVIRKLSDSDDKLHFQFTEEYMSNDEFHYRKEADLILNKTTGIVHCSSYDLQKQAQDLIDSNIQTRTKSDVTRIVQKLFNDHGDLFPIREQGGAYFVPARHLGLCDKIEAMLMQIGGKLKRHELKESDTNKQNAVEMISDGIKDMITKYEKYMADMKSDDPKVLSKGMKRITEIRIKLNAYKDVLADYGDEISDTLKKITKGLIESASNGFGSGEADEDGVDINSELGELKELAHQ